MHVENARDRFECNCRLLDVNGHLFHLGKLSSLRASSLVDMKRTFPTELIPQQVHV